MHDGAAPARPGPAARLVAWLSAPLPMRAFVPLLGAAVVAPFLFYWAVWGDFQTFSRFIGHCPEFFCDFVEVYDPMGRAAFAGHGPVHLFLYPPVVAVGFAVLALLTPHHALIAWGIVQALALVGMMACAWALLDGGRRPVFLLHVVVLLSGYPLLDNLKWGQVSVPITALILAALVLVRRPEPKAHAAAGLLAAAAVAVKLYPAAFIPAVVGPGRWRVFPWLLGGCVLLLAVVPAVALGPGEAVAFYAKVFSRYSPAISQDINSLYAPAVLDRWLRVAADVRLVRALFSPMLHPVLAGVARHADLVRAVLTAAGSAVVVLNVALGALIWWRRIDGAGVWVFLLAAATLPFVVPSSWPHYFVFLPFGQAYALHRLTLAGRRPGTVLAVAVLLVLPSMAMASAALFVVMGGWQLFNYFGLVFWADLLMLLALYLALPRAFWAPARLIRRGPRAAAPG